MYPLPACSDACPVNLMPQQLYWYARGEDHQKSEEYCLKDCIEVVWCLCLPSHIPLIQYFRQEKALIWEIKEKAKKAEEAKIRFEAKQARVWNVKSKERKARSQRAAEARREELAKQKVKTS